MKHDHTARAAHQARILYCHKRHIVGHPPFRNDVVRGARLEWQARKN
jgi:hypothetical protein